MREDTLHAERSSIVPFCSTYYIISLLAFICKNLLIKNLISMNNDEMAKKVSSCGAEETMKKQRNYS